MVKIALLLLHHVPPVLWVGAQGYDWDTHNKEVVTGVGRLSYFHIFIFGFGGKKAK